MPTKKELTLRFFEIYKKYGFKSVTIDDLANNLHISKKTIYKYFKNRDDIIKSTMELYLEKSENLMEFDKNESDVFDQLIHLFLNLLNFLNEFNDVFFLTLRKHHPESYQVLVDFREGFYYQNLRKIVIKGIDDENIRKELDVEAFIYSHFMHFPLYLGDAELGLERANISSKSFFNLLINNIRGITTLKGFKLLESKNRMIENVLKENNIY